MTRCSVLIQDEGGEFSALEPIPSGGNAPVAIAAGRLDDNDSPDLVVAQQRAKTAPARSTWRCCSRTGTRFTPPEGGRSRPTPRTISCSRTSTRTASSTSPPRGRSCDSGWGTDVRSGHAGRRHGRRGGSCRGTSTVTAIATPRPARRSVTRPDGAARQRWGRIPRRRAGAVGGRRAVPPDGVRDRPLQRRPAGRPLRHAQARSTRRARRRMARARLPGRRRRRPELDRATAPGRWGRARPPWRSRTSTRTAGPTSSTANSAGPATNTVSVLLNTTPWPLLQFPTGDVAEMGELGGQHDQRLRDPEHPEHRRGRAARAADRVRRHESGRVLQDDGHAARG